MIFHAVEQHASNEARIKRVRANWNKLYQQGKMQPAHLANYRFSSKLLGDDKDLPLVTEILMQGKLLATSDDVVLLTNDDTLLHPWLFDMLGGLLKTRGAVASRRLNIESDTPFETTDPNQLATTFKADYGRDLFAFTGAWLTAHWHEIPTMFVGEWEWDLIVSYLIRISAGEQVTDLHKRTSTDLPLGYALHEKHPPAWQSKQRLTAPAKWWNRSKAQAWYEDHGLLALYTLG